MGRELIRSLHPRLWQTMNSVFLSQGNHSTLSLGNSHPNCPRDVFCGVFFLFVPHLIPKWIRDASNKRQGHNITIRIENQRFAKERRK